MAQQEKVLYFDNNGLEITRGADGKVTVLTVEQFVGMYGDFSYHYHEVVFDGNGVRAHQTCCKHYFDRGKLTEKHEGPCGEDHAINHWNLYLEHMPAQDGPQPMDVVGEVAA